MTNKTILVLAIAATFVAGTLVSGAGAFGDKDDGNPIVSAINALTEAVQGINPTVNVDPTPVILNVDPTPINVNVDSEQT